MKTCKCVLFVNELLCVCLLILVWIIWSESSVLCSVVQSCLFCRIRELSVEFIRCSSTRQINPKHSKSLNYRQFRDVLNSVGLGNVSTLSNRVSFLDCGRLWLLLLLIHLFFLFQCSKTFCRFLKCWTKVGRIVELLQIEREWSSVE